MFIKLSLATSPKKSILEIVFAKSLEHLLSFLLIERPPYFTTIVSSRLRLAAVFIPGSWKSPVGGKHCQAKACHRWSEYRFSLSCKWSCDQCTCCCRCL